MAVLTLHEPDATLGANSVAVGNYIDLSTEQVRIFQPKPDRKEQFKIALGSAPEGAVLATGVKSVPVNVAIEPGWRPDEDLTGAAFNKQRLKFDLMTFENAGVDGLRFEKRNLADPDFNLTVGTRVVLRFKDRRSGWRYFRILVHGGIGDAGTVIPTAAQELGRRFDETLSETWCGLAGVTRGGVAQTQARRLVIEHRAPGPLAAPWARLPEDRFMIGPPAGVE